MNLWNDGRSGTAGCVAGNLVLAHVRDTQKEEFQERKGTTFRGRASIWIGRMCSTDSYLFGRDRHWANLSLEQHREVTHEASLEGATVKYLFITALAGEPVIHYWIVPSEVIERIAFSDPRLPGDYVYSLHIREDDHEQYILEGEEVSGYHHVLKLPPAAASRVQKAFDADRTLRQRREEKRKPAKLVANSASAEVSSSGIDVALGRFQIPLKGGRSAVLQVPLPAADVDLVRIKGWIDLMNDVLTEPRENQSTVEARRETAVNAVKQLQSASAAARKDRMSISEIDNEIRAVRRERR